MILVSSCIAFFQSSTTLFFINTMFTKDGFGLLAFILILSVAIKVLKNFNKGLKDKGKLLLFIIFIILLHTVKLYISPCVLQG